MVPKLPSFTNSKLGTHSYAEWRNDVGTPQPCWTGTIDHNYLQEEEKNGEELRLSYYFSRHGEYDISTNLLIDSEEEQIILMADLVLVRGT